MPKLMVLVLLSLLAVSVFAEYERTEDFAPVTFGPRKRVAEKTLLFAEFLAQYGQHHNYLHKWIDRPLFWNRSLRPADNRFTYQTAESFAIHAREARRAGLDGFNFIPIKGRLGEFLRYRTWADELGLRGYSSLFVIAYGEDSRKRADANWFAQVISAAQKDSRFPRVNGRPLVPTYNHSMYSADEHRALTAELKQLLGNGDFMLCGDVSGGVMARLHKGWKKSGTLDAAGQAELEAAIRGVLDVAGGVQITAPTYDRRPEGPYCRRYGFEFFDRYVVPTVEKLCALPEYSDKAVGFYVRLGYINHKSGDNDAEDGTDTLRRNLRSVARLNPDYLMFFEWNEEEENTMFQPTITGGSVIGRILRYHARLFAGLEPDVFPGDDATVPPLALSYRITARIGEELRFEILNIPDGVFRTAMKVKLELWDDSGCGIESFPEEKISPDLFGAITYRVSTANLSAGASLSPALVVNGKRYEGFSPIRIDPSISFNYKTSRHALRDLAHPTDVMASVVTSAPGQYDYFFKGDFGEPLASVELVADENEQAAFGSEKEYDFESNIVVRLSFTAPPAGSGAKSVKVGVRNAKGCRFSPLYAPNVAAGNPAPIGGEEAFKLSDLWFWHEELVHFIQVPKKQIADAVIEIDAGPGTKPAEFPLATIATRGCVSAILDERNSFRADASRMTALPDLPPHIGLNAITWGSRTECRRRYPVFHFRVVTESGRLWRSKPMRADAIPQETIPVSVFDEFAGKPVTADIRSALIPEIVYEFEPSTGAALSNGWSPWYDAHLGGGLFYCEAYYDSRIKVAPGSRAPAWVKDDGMWCLRFDGANDYVHLPREALPQAAFTLEMEIKPELVGTAPMTLFRHFNWTRGSVSLFIVNGELVATWGDRDLTREPRFRTGLAVRSGEWSRVSVSYDFTEFIFKVNGVKKVIPWRGRAWGFRPSVFGGHDKNELSPGGGSPVYYCGLLRKLDIRHRGPRQGEQ